MAKDTLEGIIRQTQKGFIVVGELALGTDLQYIWSFIRTLKWPVLIESLSNLRTNVPADCEPYIITTYDALLKSGPFKQQVAADTVIRFGAQPVSKFLTIFLTETEPTHYVVVDEDPMFRDSVAVSTHFIHASIGKWLNELNISGNRINEEYVKQWQKGETIAKKHIENYSANESDEGAMVRMFLESFRVRVIYL